MPSSLQIKCRRVGREASLDLSNATQEWKDRQGVFIQVTDSARRQGWGEASPLPGYSSDTLKQALDALVNLQFFAEEDFEFASIPIMLRAIPDTIPSARFALECALLDLLSQRSATSMSALLGGASRETGRCALLMAKDSPLAAAKAILERGVNTAKLKVGRDWRQELAWIRDLRAQLPALNLRIDVNGAWSLAEANTRLADVAGLGLEFVEQPVSPLDMMKLGNSPTPLAADESLRDRAGIEALAPLFDSKVLVAVVLKPTILGGLLPSLALAAWAKKRGVHSIASHTFEGPIATAALAEFAIALDSPFAPGVDRHDALAAFPAMSISQLSGIGLNATSPGLGISLDL